MMKSVVIIIGLMSGFLSATSIEFPICTAPGEQFYPDVCWDGSAFWIVWQDEELGAIHGVRVNDNGEFLTNEVELLPKANEDSPARYPCVAAGGGRIGVEGRVKIGYDEFGNEAWGVGHNEFDFDGNPLHQPVLFSSNDYDYNAGSTPCLLFGEKRFFSIHRHSYVTPGDVHASTGAFGFDSAMSYTQIWQSSEVELEFFPPVACWDGERFVVLFWDALDQVQKGAFFSDSIYYKGIGEDFTWPWGVTKIPTDDLEFETKYQTLTPGGSGYFLVNQTCVGYKDADYVHGMVFYILDSVAMPLDSGKTISFFPDITCYYPDASFNGKDFVAVWENRFKDSTVHLYAIEVDTSGEILKSGYVVLKGPCNQQLALAYGGGKHFLTWSDNREGNFDIRGMIFDTLEVFEGILEKLEPFEECVLQASPNPFSDMVELYFSSKGGDNQTRTVFIFDALGRRVNALEMKPGEERIFWEGRDSQGGLLPSGVYFAALSEGKLSSSTKILKIK